MYVKIVIYIQRMEIRWTSKMHFTCHPQTCCSHIELNSELISSNTNLSKTQHLYFITINTYHKFVVVILHFTFEIKRPILKNHTYCFLLSGKPFPSRFSSSTFLSLMWTYLIRKVLYHLKTERMLDVSSVKLISLVRGWCYMKRILAGSNTLWF